MTPRIETTNEKKLVGKRLTMSFANYKVGELWKSFIPRRKDINNNLTNDLISLAVYKPTHFADFKPTNEFDRWATVEVADFFPHRVFLADVSRRGLCVLHRQHIRYIKSGISRNESFRAIC